MSSAWKQLCLVCVAALSLPVYAGRAGADAATLYTASEPGFVRLKWAADDWPEARAGYIVKRRQPDVPAHEAWVVVTPAAIVPCSSISADLARIEPLEPDRKALEERRRLLLDAGVMPEMDADAFRARLSREPDFRTYVAQQVRDRMDVALTCGFGTVDRSLKETGRYEYGLFEVGADGSTSRVAVATASATVPSLRITRLVLHGEARDDVARLLWVAERWEPNWKGFQVWKRDATSDLVTSAWQQVSDMIEPGLWEGRKLDLQGLDTAKTRVLASRQQEEIAKLPVPLTPPDMRRRLMSADLESLRIFAAMLRRDCDFALLNGFGFEDHDYTGPSEYRICPVTGAGEVLTNEAANRLVVPYEPESPDLALKPDIRELAGGKLLVVWHLSFATLDRYQLLGFDLYRRPKGKPDATPEKLNLQVMTSSSSEAGTLEWTFVDDRVKVGASYEYTVVPISIFRTERRSREWSVSGPVPATLKPPEIQLTLGDVKTPEEGSGMEVAWDVAGSDASILAGFKVEECDMTTTNEPIATREVTFPAGARSGTVPWAHVHGHVYRYRVVGLDSRGRRFPSDSKVVIYSDAYVPRAPTGVAAVCLEKDGRAYLRLTWQNDAASNALVRGYAFWSDRYEPGVLRRHTSLPVARTNEVVLPVTECRGRELQVGVAAISEYGDQGKLAVVRCYVPVVEMPQPGRLNAVLAPDGMRASLTWIFPEIREVRGFRIYQNGALVADEYQVPGSARTWTGGALPANRLQRFRVVAVGQNGQLSHGSPEVELYRLQSQGEPLRGEAPDAGGNS